jgi:hypothetical protein
VLYEQLSFEGVRVVVVDAGAVWKAQVGLMPVIGVVLDQRNAR